MAKLTKNGVAKALTETHGNISAAARMLGVTRRAIAKRIDGDPILKAAVVDARETMLDDAERSLAKAVLAGEAWAVCFLLKTQGRGRGYIERVATDAPPASTVHLNIVESVVTPQQVLDEYSDVITGGRLNGHPSENLN